MNKLRFIIKEVLKKIFETREYVGKNEFIFRGGKPGENKGYYTTDKGMAMGYMPYGGKLYKINIKNKRFIDKSELYENGEIFKSISEKFPIFFNSDIFTTELKDNINKTEYYKTIGSYLISIGYSGIYDKDNNEFFIY